jgi:molybdate/tungstate transport system substrate-binding protein
LLESAGSVESARKITDLHKPCDIMASSDYRVIDRMLIPGYASWNIPFASNEMCIVFTKKSRYAGQISRDNWFNILQKKEVIYGRSDPNADPCGYRSVMTMMLAEKYYGVPGLAGTLTGKDRNYIRPKEVDLLALLEAGALDYIFLYRSVAIQHDLEYLALPVEINLQDPSCDRYYSAASLQINGKKPGEQVTASGEAMIYGVTMLNNAPNARVALAFLEYMLSPGQGMKILEREGQPSVIPMQASGYDALPVNLKKFAIKP